MKCVVFPSTPTPSQTLYSCEKNSSHCIPFYVIQISGLHGKVRFDFVSESIQQPVAFFCFLDADGDEITLTSDEELIIALTEMKDDLKVLYVGVKSQRPEIDDDETPRAIPSVICDGCETVITDLRYKCIQCPDFDLCVKCESQGLHPEHIMLRFFMEQYEMPRSTGKMLHNFFRGLRKSGHYASKHQHKQDKERRHKKDAWCRQERPQGGGCPFSAAAKEGEAPWEGIQEMARPYVYVHSMQTHQGLSKIFFTVIRFCKHSTRRVTAKGLN